MRRRQNEKISCINGIDRLHVDASSAQTAFAQRQQPRRRTRRSISSRLTEARLKVCQPTSLGSRSSRAFPMRHRLFRILGCNVAMYLDRTCSGNETAAHLGINDRLTIMFCAVSGPPLIMRLFGKGRVIHRDSDEFASLLDDRFDGNAARRAADDKARLRSGADILRLRRAVVRISGRAPGAGKASGTSHGVPRISIAVEQFNRGFRSLH